MRGPGEDARDADADLDPRGSASAGEKPTSDAAPGIDEAVRQLGAAGRATWSAGRDAGKAFRILLSADVSLARSAFGRTLAFTGAAIAFGASGWLLLMAAMIAGLNRGLGWPWWVSLLLAGVLSVAITVAAGWQAMRYFDHTRLQATRRQLARMGIGELSDFMPDAGSGASSEQAAERVAEVADDQPIKKGLGVDITPP